MNCDLCGKNLNYSNYVTYEKVEGSRLCHDCFEAVNAEVSDKDASPEEVVAAEKSITSGQLMTESKDECRCHSCGAICDSTRQFCTKCGKKLINSIDIYNQTNCQNNGNQQEVVPSTTTAAKQNNSIVPTSLIIAAVFLIGIFQVPFFRFGKYLLVILVCIVAIMFFNSLSMEDQPQSGKKEMGCLAKIFLTMFVVGTLLAIAIHLVCQNSFYGSPFRF